MRYKAPRELGQTFIHNNKEFKITQIIMTEEYNSVYAIRTNEEDSLLNELYIKYDSTNKQPTYYCSSIYNVGAYFIEPYGNEWLCITKIIYQLNDNNEKEIWYTLRNTDIQCYTYSNEELKQAINNKELIYISSNIITGYKKWDYDNRLMRKCNSYIRDFITGEIKTW